jgi:branched-chain amino acid transport system ATP-binding protein
MMIEARGLVVGIGSNEILHGVNVNVPKGQITAVVGANGAGKTTLLRTLSRLLPLRRGAIIFDTQSIDHVEPHKIAQRGLVHVPQGRMIIPGLTVEENLRIGANRIPGLTPPEIGQMLECEYERFPVLKSRRMVLGTSLSGGEQQMLAVSRALMMKPKLIMLDEPSLGLAPQIVSAIFRTLRELATSGTTVLLVEQAAIAALRLADVGYVLQNGAVVLSGTSASLLGDPQLIERYLG